MGRKPAGCRRCCCARGSGEVPGVGGEALALSDPPPRAPARSWQPLVRCGELSRFLTAPRRPRGARFPHPEPGPPASDPFSFFMTFLIIAPIYTLCRRAPK